MKEREKIIFMQIFMLVFSIIGFVYFIGGEVGIVSAIDQEKVAPATTTLAKPGSTYLSNLVGTGYAKGTYELGGKYYTLGKGAKIPSGGTALDSWKLAGSGADALISGFNWAAYAYIGGQMLGDMRFARQ